LAEKPRLNPLRNVGTSRVLYLLLLNPMTPTELSKHLRVAPPGTMQQLHRLELLGVARRGEKRGKSQYYELDEDGVVGLFTDALREEVRLWIEIPREPGEERALPAPGEIEEAMERLKRNGRFRRLVIEYLRRVPHPRALKAIVDFVGSVAWFCRRLGKREPKDREARELLDLMRKLDRWSGESEIETMDALMEAMEEAGLR
jgi:DNA-binding transcriptional ArsR family regulator